ncbi:MAG: hypothetical protein ABIQ96_22110 [Luteolibacter sp.]
MQPRESVGEHESGEIGLMITGKAADLSELPVRVNCLIISIYIFEPLVMLHLIATN